MPLYEYRCSTCDQRIEVIQSFSAKPLKKCEACGGRLEKLISRSGFVLKGGGWYKTDYAPSGGASSKAAKDGGSDESSGASAAASGADTAAKAEAAPKDGGSSPGASAETSSKPKARPGRAKASS